MKKIGQTIRQATHAGTWYSNNAKQLDNQLGSYLLKATNTLPTPTTNLRALICPHAGFRYSGPTAAWSYININPQKYNNVIILGPSHHFPLKECGVSVLQQIETPLGNMFNNLQIAGKLIDSKIFFPLPKELEEPQHSIEMQYPFLRKVFGDRAKNGEVKFVSIMVGDAPSSMLSKYAEELSPYMVDQQVLFVVSSDFCHHGSDTFGYAPTEMGLASHEVITKLDRRGMDIIESGTEEEFSAYLKETRNTICGRNPIRLMMSILENIRGKKKKEVNYTTKFVKYAQSSKAMVPKDHSVSYASSYTAWD